MVHENVNLEQREGGDPPRKWRYYDRVRRFNAGMRGAGDVRLYVSVAVAGNSFFVYHPMNRCLSGVEFRFGGRPPEVILSD